MVTIRPATPAHAPLIHALQGRAFAEEARLSGTRQIPPLMEPVDAIESHIRTQTVLVACDAERVVGAARGIVDGAVCTLRGVIVEPACHGRGIGSMLLWAIEAAHPRVARFELITNTLVPGNVRFYEQRGYRVDERVPHGETIVLARMSKAGPGGGA
jgi:predicted N-acetyltransferase YhbS